MYESIFSGLTLGNLMLLHGAIRELEELKALKIGVDVVKANNIDQVKNELRKELDKFGINDIPDKREENIVELDLVEKWPDGLLFYFIECISLSIKWIDDWEFPILYGLDKAYAENVLRALKVKYKTRKNRARN